MLEKISNIKANKSYSDKRGNQNYARLISKPSIDESVVKDSIVLSPATLFLSQIKWHLINIESKSSGKLSLNFIVSDLEFFTIFDLNSFFNSIRHSFRITGKNNKSYKDEEIALNISIKKTEVYLLHHETTPDFWTIKYLFERISDLKVTENIGNEDSNSLNILIDGFYKQLYSELQIILIYVYSFIDKLNEFNLPENHKFNDDGSELITIENISTLHGSKKRRLT